jgi:hypothetical protein
MIVAWHEVPGTAPPQKNRPVGYGMIRAGVLHRFEVWREEISNAVSLSRPTGRFFRGTLSLALRAWLRSCFPSGTRSHSPIEGPRIKLALIG